MKDFEVKDISTEQYREYIMNDNIYRIDNPLKLYIKPGSKYHRVVDANYVAHCIPAPGDLNCYAVRWKNKDTSVPVNF